MELWLTEKHSPNVGFTLKIKRCILHRETRYQKLDILESFEYGKILLLDGLIMFTERDEFVYHEMISHVPLVIHPNPKQVLIVGGGDGGTVREVLKHPEVKKIDLVEIDNEVIDSCLQYFPNVSHGLSDPKVRIFIEDGMKFIAEKHNIYDLIIIDSTDPIGPAEGLFEPKFYSEVYKALKADGIMVTQSESPFQDKNLWAKIYKNLSSVFPKTFSYLAFIPSYPSGMWSFTIGSKTVHPVDDIRDEYALDLSLKTQYYNPSIHKSSFSLPNLLHL
jgi:spermidine synthase